jgi:hypothetical protein
MTLDELYKLKEDLMVAQMEVDRLNQVVNELPDELKEEFDGLVIW